MIIAFGNFVLFTTCCNNCVHYGHLLFTHYSPVSVTANAVLRTTLSGILNYHSISRILRQLFFYNFQYRDFQGNFPIPFPVFFGSAPNRKSKKDTGLNLRLSFRSVQWHPWYSLQALNCARLSRLPALHLRLPALWLQITVICFLRIWLLESANFSIFALISWISSIRPEILVSIFSTLCSIVRSLYSGCLPP